MLDAFRRWFAGGVPGSDWRAVAAWAEQRGARFKRAHENEGFVIDGLLEGRAWRLEWGPPQRAYIEGHELRLRMELGLSQDLQMLLLSRPLMETLERQTFEHYTAHMQTQIDVSTPEEMRWLAMFPKVQLSGSKEVKSRFAAVAASPTVAAGWIDGLLSERLAEAALGSLAEGAPLVLMTLRGRVYLRLQLAEPDVATVEAMVNLFETAAAQAVRITGGPRDGPDAWPSTASTAWQTHLQPEPPKR
jgi:hypothetical protein